MRLSTSILLVSISITILFTFTSVHILHLDSPSEIITEQDVHDYLSEFFRIFNQQLETRFGLNSTAYRESLNYSVYATVSTTHGASIEFFPSNKSEFTFRTVAQPIETAVFPDLRIAITPPDLKNATIIRWSGEPNGTMFNVADGAEIVFKTLIIITNKSHFIGLGGKSEVYLFDVAVDGRYYHAMILRSGNTREYWTTGEARKDAEQFFEQKSYFGFSQAQIIKQTMAYPVFVQLLSPVLWKQYNANETGYTLVQHEQDLNEVRRIAVDMYHFQASYADAVYDWLEKITPRPIEFPKPPWYEAPPWSWIIGGIIGAIITPIGTMLWRRLPRAPKKQNWQLSTVN